MITIIKNGYVYSLNFREKDVLIVSSNIEGVYDNLDIPKEFGEIKVIDAKENIVITRIYRFSRSFNRWRW